MLKHYVWAVCLAMPALCLGADSPPDIKVQASGSDAYVLTLTSAAITNVSAAQALLMPAAQKVCAGKTPQFGHYKFESKAPLSVTGNDTKTSFMIDQEIVCADSVPQVVNPSTTDPNWQPSNADHQAVIDTVTKYFAAKDSGNVAGSYALLDDGMGISLKEWKNSSDDFASQTGVAVSHKVMKLTWYKDPQNAPKPGVYAAADFVDHYDKATNCGYLSMYQEPDGSFLVIHEQDGLIPNQSNMTSAQITESKAKLGCVGDEAAPLPEAKGDPIGYPDVATARKELLARKDGQPHTEGDGWLVIYFPSEYTIWTFAPENDPAYPAVVRRVITRSDKSTYISMSVLCQASKAACDNLVRQFNELDDRVKASLSRH